MSGSLPLVMSASGPQPTSPDTLRSTLIANVAASNPGYTVLGAGLIEDLSSTAVGAIALIDQARVDAVNSVTPYGANASVLNQLGLMFGLPQGLPTNANAYVQFTGTPGFVIPPGFLVSDGSYQYSVVDGGVINSQGTTLLYVVCTVYAQFAIPAGAITEVITSVNSAISLTCTNPQAGVPASNAESIDSYRSRIMSAFSVTSTGTPAALTTALNAIPGVNSRLVSIVQTANGWEIICGGGDPYQVAYAILSVLPDIANLTGAQNTGTTIQANIFQNPNVYSINYVNPTQANVSLAVLWNTIQPNFTTGAGVNQLATTALVNYINSIPVGAPINLLEMTNVFQTAVQSILSPINLTTLEFTVEINGETVNPTAGSSAIISASETYYYASASSVIVTQG